MAIALSLGTVSAETREVVAGPEYDRASIDKFWWGENYRNLWLTPVEVEVLDLQNEAGGLTPTFRVGGTQTRGLALTGADGRSYTFRSINKNLRDFLPPEWGESVFGDNVQDQVSATHPGVVEVLSGFSEQLSWMEEPSTRIVIMPDDPALGEFREGLAGTLGTFGEYPSVGNSPDQAYSDATEMLSTRDLWSRWETNPQEIDAELFLRYRIFDIWLGNWDRHSKQWRWAYRPETASWSPIAEDPDQIFANYQGALIGMARWYFPKVLTFKDEISRMEGAAANGADIDRWLLTEIGYDAFMQIARSVQAELTDEVINSAVRQMPEEWYDVNGAELVATLMQRRENLLEGIERYYHHLADQVSIRGSNQDERVDIVRTDDGSVSVSLSLANNAENNTPYYQRTFSPDETKAVRIYVYDGDDQIITSGSTNNKIRVHVVGGKGDDHLDNTEAGYAFFHDFEGENTVLPGRRTKVDEEPYENPAPSTDNPWLEPRDYGTWWTPDPYINWNPDLGVVLGAGMTRTSWSFRNYPFNDKHRVTARVSGKRGSAAASYSNLFHLENSNFALGGTYMASGLESVNFFGFGNDTPGDTGEEPPDFFEVADRQFSAHPQIIWGLDKRLTLALGVEVKYSEESSTNTLIELTQPYGSGEFSQAGVVVGVNWRSKGLHRMQVALSRFELYQAGDAKLLPNSGFELSARGKHSPSALDLEESFSSFEAEMSGHLVIGNNDKVMLSGKLGGKKIWGRYPWRDAAFIGGQDSNRGYDWNRFAGHSSVYGRAELRVHVFDAVIFIPGRVWVYGLADAGRVWFDENDSNSWHPSYGGGLAFELPASPLKFRFEAVKSKDEGDVHLYFATGLSF